MQHQEDGGTVVCDFLSILEQKYKIQVVKIILAEDGRIYKKWDGGVDRSDSSGQTRFSK